MPLFLGEDEGYFRDEVADRIEPIWGLDQQGEKRSVWQRTRFWGAVGNFWLSRHFSRFLPLQIKAIEEGITLL